MAEDTPQAQSPVTDTPASPMPSDQAQKTPDVPEQTGQQDGLPDNTSERTKHEFEKMQSDYRAQLQEERQRRITLEDAFKTMQQPKPNAAVTLSPLYTPEGYIDEQAMAERDTMLLQSQQETVKLRQELEQERSRLAQQQQDRDTTEAYTAHPELDPNAKTFDTNLSEITKSLILQSMLHPENFGNKQLSFKEAGDQAKGMVSKIAESAKTMGAQQAIEQLSPKEQATLEATGSPTRGQQGADNLDSLRFQSRRGSLDAIVERMNRLKGKA